jgi:trans-aconitate 2-methyltransferase
VGNGAPVAGRGTAGPDRPTAADWNPVTYLRYGDERARPFVDLLARVGAPAPSVVVDLGCGQGELTASLARRWPRARITGVDSSATMLAAAAAHAVRGRVEFIAGDVRSWKPDEPVDLLVTNAVLHWVPGHDELLTRWAAGLAPGGWLALQVPGNFRAPTHALLAELCRSAEWSDRLAGAAPRPDAVLEPDGYLDVLAAAGLVADVWETTYLHVLTGPDPVLGWVRSTQLRPLLALLDDADAGRFTEQYAAALREAYPMRADGTTLLPFRRIFAVGSRPAQAPSRGSPRACEQKDPLLPDPCTLGPGPGSGPGTGPFFSRW